MYSSNALSPAFGAVNSAFKPAFRYSGVGLMVHPLGHPAGHDGSRCHLFVPVSNAVTGATSIFGASSLRK
jgi:hypothetical protein